jgi:pheromone receptor transcription factor
MDNNKKTKGRQRIDTSKRRESEEDRLITFSNHRVGLYKKDSELCTLCGTPLAVLVFSPSGKPFSFVHPNIEVIAWCVLENKPRSNGVMDAYRRNRINELNE